MSQDPFLQREAEKYENPVPSREYILTYLQQRGKPARREEIAAELNIQEEEQLEGLRRRLRAMERDGQLVFTRRQCYVLPENLDLIKGKVIGHRDGFGFLRIENQKDDFYLSAEQMKLCMHGDMILAQPLGADRKGRREAQVIRIVEPRNALIVGRYFVEAGAGFVVPDDSRLSFDILVEPDATQGARMGAVVVVELLKRPTRRLKALGRITEVLGDNMGTGLAVEMALRTHEIPHIWPEEVEQQIASLNEQVPESAKQGRVDLRDLPLVTIDGEDARDFDDAVYCEKKRGGGWRLWVAIADVTYYVRPDTPLDIEAQKRGTSVYFPSQVVPMLPEVLSNGLCSLNPQVDRLCLVCEMTVSSSGKLTGYKHYEAVMNSHARLTYNKVANILQGDHGLREQYAPLVRHLETLHQMFQALETARQQRGGISFETGEPKFIFNTERRIDRIERTSRNDAHKLIEECMILANIASARFAEKHQEPVLFRDHDKPTDESIKSFRTVLSELGLSLPGGNKTTPLNYAELLETIRERPDAEMLQTMLLRSMKQAVYDPENRGHFGLALTSYAHFTSPIRRYPDLLLHRSIKYLLACEAGQTVVETTPGGGKHYDLQQMLQLGQHCSLTERRADEATRDVADWLKCDFMQDHVGEEFSGVIASVTNFGFFVRLNDLFIDGLVHISSLDKDYYHYDPVGQRLVGGAGGETYRLGDSVEIRVAAVHLDERKIDFVLVSSQRLPRGAGKTTKQKAKRGDKNSVKRHEVGKQSNFEADSEFRGKKTSRSENDDAVKPAKHKVAKKLKKVSKKTQAIAAATKAKRAAKKQYKAESK